MRRNQISGGNLTPEEKKRLKKERKRLEREEYERDEEKPKKKKKKMGCCGCFLIMTLVFVLFIGAGIGAGCFFGNKWLKKNYGISLSDAFSVLGALYDADEDKIVTNAPSDTDEAGFYAKLNDKLFLADGTIEEGSFNGVIKSLTGGNETQTSETLQTQKVFLSGGEGTAVEDVIKRENVDFTKLAKFTDEYDYELSYSEDFIVSVTDREIMALIKPVLEEKLSGVKLIGPNLSFEQITFTRTADDIPMMGAVVEIDVDDLVAEAIGNSGTPKFVRKVVKVILPDEIFVTLTVTLADDMTGDILINSMNAKQQATLHKLISAISGRDSKAVISDFIAKNAQGIVNKADEMLGFDENIGAGTMNFDLFSLLAGTAFKNSDMSGSEMAMIYTTVLKAETEKMLDAHTADMFEGQYLEPGKETPTYSKTEIPGATAINYRQQFVDELSSKYLISTEFYRNVAGKVYLPKELKGTLKEGEEYIPTLYLNAETGEVKDKQTALFTEKLDFVKLEFEDMASLFGIGSSEKTATLSLQSIFNADGLTQKIGGGESANKTEWYINQSDETLKMELSDKMLATLVDVQVKNVMGDDSALTSSLDLKFLNLTKNTAEEIELTDENGVPFIPAQKVTVERKFMTMGFTLDTKKMFEGVGLITGLLEEQIGLVATVEITPEIEEKYLTQPVLIYADLSQNRTDRVLDTLVKMGMDFLTPEKIQDLIGKPIRNAIITMRDTLGGVDLMTGEMKVPDVFTLLTKQMFPANDSKTYKGERIEFAKGEVHNVLRLLYDVPETIVNESKVYLAVKDASDELTLVNVFGEGIDNDSARVDKLNLWKSSASSLPDEVKPTDLNSDLGKVVGYHYDEVNDKMFLSYEYALAQYLGSDSSASSLLTVEKIYATFEITFEGGILPVTKMSIDKMTAEERNSLEKMMTYFNSANEGKFTSLEQEVGVFGLKVKALEDAGFFDSSL